MTRHASAHGERGFSLVELLIVVAIVALMAGVALPGIAQYIRNYKIRGAAQEVTGELQAARSKAIMSNTNAGVSFVVVDADSYRFVQEDLTGDEAFGPLKDLPGGLTFVVATAAGSGPSLRFNRLGGYCNPAGSSCAPAVATVCRPEEVTLRCSNGGGANYVAPQASGSVVITLLENTTQLRRTVQVAPGGRVMPSEGWEKKP